MSNAKLFLAIVLPSIVAGCTDLELTIDHCGYDYSQNLFVLQGHAELTNQTDEEEKKNAGKTFDVTCEFTMGDTVACATSVRTTQGDFTCSCEPWEEDLFGELRCLAVEGNVLEEGL